ncbi:hypothetical protein BDC45DRAFT_542272 [Circinella umbellata]|nr:hypothetical protein BDC45DRAFT_542272 [Circinella umbellata]
MAFSDHQISRLFINVTLTFEARPSEYDNSNKLRTIRNDVLSINIFASKRNSNDHNNYFLINSLVFQSLEITISNDDDDDEEEGDTQETNEEGPGILQTQAKQDQIMQYLLYQWLFIFQVELATYVSDELR